MVQTMKNKMMLVQALLIAQVSNQNAVVKKKETILHVSTTTMGRASVTRTVCYRHLTTMKI